MDTPSVDAIKKQTSGLLAAWWRDLRIATAFFTRLPLPTAGVRFGVDEDGAGSLASASRAFPLVGAGVGLVAAAGFAAASWLGLPSLVSALAALGISALITGGLHEDGLADTADGFGGAADRVEKLRLMRDSRTGTYGVLALIFSVALRAALLAAAPAAAFGALIAAGALSRAVLPGIMAWVGPARADGLGAAAGRPDKLSVGIGAGIAAAVAVAAVGWAAGIAACLLAAAAAVGVAAMARAHVGGFTGDVLGATQQVAEGAVLLAVAVAVSS